LVIVQFLWYAINPMPVPSSILEPSV
jgi:hypothetical protein